MVAKDGLSGLTNIFLLSAHPKANEIKLSQLSSGKDSSDGFSAAFKRLSYLKPLTDDFTGRLG